jgi:DHA2 family multidrug resistance protein
MITPATQPPAVAPAPSIFPFAVMCVGMFVALLDIQIVASSLQDIGGGLSAAQDDINWVQTAYLIAEIIVIPLSGWLTRVFSTRWLFAASAAGFTVTSMLCGIAWNIESMIVFRALQGMLGASMIPTVFTSSFHYFPGRRRVYSAAVVGMIASVAPVLGPVIGGWITDTINWHWLFYVNLVPGLLVAVAVPLLVDIDRPDLSLLKGADYLGMALMALALGTLEYFLEEGRALELVRRSDHYRLRLDRRDYRHPVRRAQPDLRPASRRSARPRQPQLLARLLFVVRHRHRYLFDDLSDAAISRLCPRL